VYVRVCGREIVGLHSDSGWDLFDLQDTASQVCVCVCLCECMCMCVCLCVCGMQVVEGTSRMFMTPPHRFVYVCTCVCVCVWHEGSGGDLYVFVGVCVYTYAFVPVCVSGYVRMYVRV